MTAFGIFWGTAILAMLIGGSKGLKSFMSRNFEGFATNVAIVFPGRTTVSYGGFNKGMEVQLNLQDVINIRRAIPEIEKLIGCQQSLGRGSLRAEPDHRTADRSGKRL